MNTPNHACLLDVSDIFQDIVNDPVSPQSSFLRLHQLFPRIACASEPVEVLNHLSPFVKAILLTSILHEDLTVVADQAFLNLCRAADNLSVITPTPGMEPWNESQPDTFHLKAENFSRYWSDVALFQRDRADVIDLCSALMKTHERRLKSQTCRMYNSGNLSEADGVPSLLQFVNPNTDFTAPSYFPGSFGDFLSRRKRFYSPAAAPSNETQPSMTQSWL